MLVPTYKPRNPELIRLMEDMNTPKRSSNPYESRSPIKATPQSSMPKDAIILGENAKKYLSDLDKDNKFGIYYNTDTEQHMIGKYPIVFDFDDIICHDSW